MLLGCFPWAVPQFPHWGNPSPTSEFGVLLCPGPCVTEPLWLGQGSGRRACGVSVGLFPLRGDLVLSLRPPGMSPERVQIGRASCRERV